MTDLAAPNATGDTSGDAYVRYSDDLERPRPDEDEIIDKIVGVLRHNNERAYRIYKRGIRDAHAKSHGILRGELTVHAGLPKELAQGMFATPASYPVIARLSSTSGAIRSDQLRGVRGLGIKVLGVPGPRALPDDEATTQDFIMVTHREFLFADAHAYLTQGMPTAWALARLSDPVMRVVSDALAGLDEKVLRRIGRPLPPALAVFVRPNTHILGDTFYSSAPLRWGDHVAKVLYAPSSPEVVALQDRPMATDGVNALQDLMVDFFAEHSAEYELRVQLCTDPRVMPIEDATVPWPESLSPHRTVATIRFDRQDPYTPERRAFGDDVLSFNSWRALAAHRPLGSINRLKKRVYEASSNYRHHVNNAARVEPDDISQLPQ
ncbi:catalase family protein [Nocardia sp. alder85J]|uniref:catalase family protein n=1 Tax=Nocardia sp. alder85J TaxID=2862949 RepID=UPI001CD73261|nr:catalase family protein [Nocardia sp. alder85J]MCX4094343.1 catalase family protein [Nocardia sp. alder85J]